MKICGCCYGRFWLPVLVGLMVAGVLWVNRKSPAPPVVAGETALAASADWPMLGGTNQRNQVNTVIKNLPTEWSVEEGKERNIKWSTRLGDKAYGGPVISGGKVFVGINNQNPRKTEIKGHRGIILCLKEANGELLWQATHDPLPEEIVKDALPEGIASTPIVEGNRVYYVSNRCEVVCADTEGFHDGKNDGVQDEKYKDKTDADFIWRLDMIKDLDVFPFKMPNCSPLIVGELLYITTGNGTDEGTGMVHSPKAPSFIAVNKKTGEVAWKDNSPGVQIMQGQWSNPVYAEVKGKGQVIFGGGDGWLRSFEPKTGELIWKFDCNPKNAVKGNRGGKNYLVSTPVVYDNKVYVGGGQEPSLGTGVSHFWCIDIAKEPKNKERDLSPVNDNFDPKAEVNKDSGLVWHFGGMNDQKTADETGRDFAFGRTVSACAIHDNLLYFNELAGYFYCLDAQTGKVHWDYDLKAEVWGSPSWVDGKIYQGTGDGDVHIFAHGKEKKILGKIEMGGNIYSTPVAANGVLYVMTSRNLYAIAPK